jgi:hypothetical protein
MAGASAKAPVGTLPVRRGVRKRACLSRHGLALCEAAAPELSQAKRGGRGEQRARASRVTRHRPMRRHWASASMTCMSTQRPRIKAQAHAYVLQQRCGSAHCGHACVCMCVTDRGAQILGHKVAAHLGHQHLPGRLGQQHGEAPAWCGIRRARKRGPHVTAHAPKSRHHRTYWYVVVSRMGSHVQQDGCTKGVRRD